MNLPLFFVMRKFQRIRALKLAGSVSPEELNSLLRPDEYMARRLGKRSDINPLILAIPAMFDTVASTLLFIALMQVAASVYQMMRGLIVFTRELAHFQVAQLR